jgi:hypothetical protein
MQKYGMAGPLNYIRNSRLAGKLSLGTAGTLLFSTVAASAPTGYVVVGDRYDKGEKPELVADSGPVRDSGPIDLYSDTVPQAARDTIRVGKVTKREDKRYTIFKDQIEAIEEIAGFLNGSIMVFERTDEPGTFMTWGTYKSKEDDYRDLLKAIKMINEFGNGDSKGDRITHDPEITAYRDHLYEKLKKLARQQ